MEDMVLIYASLIISAVGTVAGLFTSLIHMRKKLKASEKLTIEMAKEFGEIESLSKSIEDLKATIKRLENEELEIKMAIDSLKYSSHYDIDESNKLLKTLAKDDVFFKVFVRSYKNLDYKYKNELYSTFSKSTDKGLNRFIKKIASSVLDNITLKI